MNRILLISILLLSQPLHAAENLSLADYPGIWASNWTATKGEKQKLVIKPNLSSIFERKFTNNNNQSFESENIDIVEDLILIKYMGKNNSLRYKLVLSGWKSNNKSMLYGTMYMYEHGKQFNGLPVTFSK